MFQRTLLTGLALSLLVVQACGSGSGKHTARPEEEGGAGGEAGQAGQAGEPAKGGSESMAGMPAGGEPPVVVPSGGAGGVPEPATGGGGEAGSGVVIVPPVPELLFTAKAGAVGLAGTGVSAQSATNPQNSIYSTKTGSQDLVDGTNEVVVTGTSLGLDPADKILSFTELQAEPQDPVYLFSLADGGEGSPSTRIYNEYWTTGADQGDVYSSDGSTTFRYQGVGGGRSGDQYGYNALVATEASIGLLGVHDGFPDDLGALLARDSNKPLGDLYFTVSSDSVGAVDGGVAAVDPMERSCTIFKSKRDGKASVAFTCSDLGLALGDAIDGLLVYGTTTPSKLVFSVTSSSQGVLDSAVKTAVDAFADVGSHLFESVGKGTNTLLKEPFELGLGDVTNDEIDGLTVIDQAKPAAVKTGTSCDITFDLFNAAQGNVVTVSGVTNIGTNVLVVLGQNATNDRAVAYDATTCANLQAVDLPSNFIQGWNLAIAPAAGWSSKTPLSNVQYLSVAPNVDSTEANLQAFDAAGVLVKAYGLGPNFPINPALYALLHDPNNDRLFIFTSGNHYYNQMLWQTAMPGAQTTSLSPTGHELALPCSTNSNVRGVDAVGNVYLAEPQGTGTGWESYAVCTYSPAGELLSPAYSWANHGNTQTLGFIAGLGPHVLFHSNGNAAPSGIQRDTHPSP